MIKLTLERVEVRPVLVPLGRPVVSRVGLYEEWPLILIDLHTKEGIVGRSYLAPYLKQAVRYIVPAIQDLAAARQDRPIAPLDDFAAGRKALGLVGLEGVSLIAVSGLDMAAGAAGIQMSSHLYPEFSSHLLRVTETGHWLEWQDWAHPILAEPFEVEGGHLLIRDVPGAGLEWDEGAVQRYRMA
jgi:L-alanine-DL-glutamate epimerase-like enolase superfamily enzyme